MGLFTGGGVGNNTSSGSRNFQEGSLCALITIKINFETLFQ